jgi:NAD(P)-dependent dehydrogenase (short-subunit alcohol dehydrogenase family)
MTMTYPFPVSGDEFKGKRVLVTGGTKGMGQAMVRRFTLSGACVATTARSPLPKGQAVALFVQTDIGTAAGVQEAISRDWARDQSGTKPCEKHAAWGLASQRRAGHAGRTRESPQWNAGQPRTLGQKFARPTFLSL